MVDIISVSLACIALLGSIASGIFQLLSNGKNEIILKSSCYTSTDDHHIEIKKAKSEKENISI